MDDIAGTGHQSGRRLIIAALVVLSTLIACLAGASAWQARVHDSKLDQVQSHTTTATLLTGAQEQGAGAATLLKQYVKTGDAALIPEIKSSAGTAVDSLSKAVAQGSVADLKTIAVDGAKLAQAVGQVVALRQSGDVAAAAAALERAAPAFDQAISQVKAAVALELDEVSALQTSAGQAQDWSSRLLIAALAMGGVLALSVTALAARSIISRRSPKPASPV